MRSLLYFLFANGSFSERGLCSANTLRHRSRVQKQTRTAGFTLLEIMIVTAILAILGAIIFPMISGSAIEARDAVLSNNLATLRKQIDIFIIQHNGNAPGFNGVDPRDHLLKYSDASGAVSSTPSDAYPLGPYFVLDDFINPFTNGSALKQSNDPAGEIPDHSLKINGEPVGWFYDPATGVIAPNAEGTNDHGVVRVSL